MHDALRIGAINWDNSLPPETYFGHHTSRVLSPGHMRHITPYYAELHGEDGVFFRPKTQESFDRELEKAIGAGIDYFAYDWYTDEKMPADPANPANVDGNVWELNHARYLHQKSALREKIHLCALLICLHPFTEGDMRRLGEAMREPYYETVEGRPLVYLFGGYNQEFIDILREFPGKYGTKDPFIVFLEGKYQPGKDYSGADGVSAYACCAENTASFREVTDYNLHCNEARKQYGVPLVPHFSVGWDPSPRIETPIPWTSYPDCPYAAPASEKEIAEGAVRFADWVRENRVYLVPNHILTFAWNEFEEGGFLCPTVESDSHLRGFAKATAYWRENLVNSR